MSKECNGCAQEMVEDINRKGEQIAKLKAELKILKNPSDGRCMEISVFRDKNVKLRAENLQLRVRHDEALKRAEPYAWADCAKCDVLKERDKLLEAAKEYETGNSDWATEYVSTMIARRERDTWKKRYEESDRLRIKALAKPDADTVRQLKADHFRQAANVAEEKAHEFCYATGQFPIQCANAIRTNANEIEAGN